MSKTKIIKKVVQPLKSLFKREDYFSQYLAENLEILSPIFGVDLDNVIGQNEVPIGPFRCDIIAQAIDETYITIENQLGRSDHTHLGKLLTYMTNMENVKIAVWVCEEATEEHTSFHRLFNFIHGDGVRACNWRVIQYIRYMGTLFLISQKYT